MINVGIIRKKMLTTDHYVTYFVNTFNRCLLLKNMLQSFEECNQYNHPFEWIITDYGSTDNTRDFLLNYSKNKKNITLLFGNENAYIQELTRKNLKPFNNRKKSHAIMGLSRNDARKLAKGDIFIEIADDHQFIRRGDWITDALSIMEHRKSKYHLDDISSILYRGLSLERIQKQNNATENEEISSNGCAYYVAKHKCYDDYHIQMLDKYHKIGQYFEPHKILCENKKEKWRIGDDSINHYEDYLEKSKIANMKKVFMKFPYVIDFPNGFGRELDRESNKLIVPLIPISELKLKFKNLNRPVSTNEILSI